MSDSPRSTSDTEIDPRAAAELIEQLARRHFGLTADEFARRWHAGELCADEHFRANEIALLLPLVER